MRHVKSRGTEDYMKWTELASEGTVKKPVKL